MQGIFQKENTDKALKYGIYRHLPTYEKIIRNLVSFYTKNAIKTHDLATKTRKNSAKTLKNALFSLENASERLWRSFLIPENALFGPSPGADPSILRLDPANNEHHRAITGRSDRLLAVFLPIYTV
jgi:hypothetical protein